MKILFSDYDNTFHINASDMKKNIEKVEEFRKNNLFVIATGRSYDSYKKQEKLFDIKCDYLVINHGATILKNDNVIYSKLIDNKAKEELVKDLELEKAENIYCYNNKEIANLEDNELTKILIYYQTHETAVKIRNLISEKYKGRLSNFVYTNNNSVEIVSAFVDKSNAINAITKLENPDEVYTIGDSYNDYLMIKKYKGSCTHVAVEEIKQISKKIYENVSDYIDDIM